MWYKQRHTAKRIWERLKTEWGFTGSYNVVQRYVKQYNAYTRERQSLELEWNAGTAQVDFGEADFDENGVVARKKYLTVSFPYSNNGFCQVFGGETAECVCQGLRDIFNYIGGIPPVLIFDNATGVGRRIGTVIHESQLFSKFRAHHRFTARFCNPRAGYEKGNVERKVGYSRANLFVPMPHFSSITEYNLELLDAHKTKAAEVHYKKNVLISELFEDDKKAFLPLPSKEFNVCRYEWLKADGYGKICLEGKHYYSTRPENGKSQVLVGIRAHTVEILTEMGEILTTHKRQFGENRTDISDYSTTLAELTKKSGAWFNCGLRKEVPDILREYMDAQPREELKTSLKMMNELTVQYGYEAAVSAMKMSAERGSINICDAAVLAARITGYGIDTPPEPGPPLEVYDKAFLCKGGESI